MKLDDYYYKQEKLAKKSFSAEYQMLKKEKAFIDNSLSGKTLYKYMSFEHFVDLLTSKKIYVPCVKSWDDNYEFVELKLPIGIDRITPLLEYDFFSVHEIDQSGRIKISNPYYLKFDFLKHFYGICFSANEDSDSLWRIYSKNNDGVAVGIKASFCENEYSSALFKMIYYDNLVKGIRERESYFQDKVKYRFIRLAFLKRAYFSHENEIRFIKIDKGVTDNLYIDIEKDMIDRIIVNPFSSDSFYSIVDRMCKNELGKKAERSLLYSSDYYEKLKAVMIYHGEI